MLTQHLYPLAPTSVNPNASSVASIPNLLGPSARNTEDNDGSQLQQIAASQRIPWRMSETNSCYNGGQPGVSNVFASALWGADYMFTLAGRASAGMNFHGGGTANYSPTAVANSGGQISAQPLYFALLLFRATARGRPVRLTVSANGANMTAYGALDNDGTLRLLVINKDMTQEAAVSIPPGGAYATALGLRLAAPAVDSTSGVTLGGTQVQATGTWLPGQLESAVLAKGVYNNTVRSSSALMVSFGNGSLAVANAASGQAVIAPGSLASAYGQALGMVESGSAVPAQGLAGVMATLTDAVGAARPLTLSYTGPSQVNFLVPDGTATGTATLQIGAVSGIVRVNGTSPGLFQLAKASP